MLVVSTSLARSVNRARSKTVAYPLKDWAARRCTVTLPIARAIPARPVVGRFFSDAGGSNLGKVLEPVGRQFGVAHALEIVDEDRGRDGDR